MLTPMQWSVARLRSMRMAVLAVVAAIGLLILFSTSLHAQDVVPAAVPDNASICVSSTLLTDGSGRAVSNEPAMDFGGTRTAFWSTFDSPTDLLQNTDGSIEIFTSERLSDPEAPVQTFQLGQVSESPGSILGGFNIMPDIVTVLADGRTFAFFASNADLDQSSPDTLNNRDGGFEIYVAQTSGLPTGDPRPRVWQLTNLAASSALLPVVSEVLPGGNRVRLAFVSDADSNESAAPGPRGSESDATQRNFELFVVTVDLRPNNVSEPARPTFVGAPLQLTKTIGQIIIDQPAISSDGRTLAFVSSAANVVALSNNTVAAGDNNEIYLARLNAPPALTPVTFFQVTNTPAGVINERPDISRQIPSETNNVRVVFVSTATTLPGATRSSSLPEVFAATVNAQATALVPANRYLQVSKLVAKPATRNLTARDPALDADGRRVVFVADGCDGSAPTCTALDSPPIGQFQLFVADLNAARTGFSISRVTNPDTGGSFRNFEAPVMSGDGQFLAAVAGQGGAISNPDLSGSEVQSLYCPRANIGPEKSFINTSGSLDPLVPDVGDVIVYTVTVANNSINEFAGTIFITDTLPPATFLQVTEVVEVTPPVGTDIDITDDNPAGGTLRWKITFLAPRGEASVRITGNVRPGAAGQQVVNSVQIGSQDINDLVEQGLLILTEQDSVSFGVTQVDLRTTFAAAPTVQAEGKVVTYTVTVSNLDTSTRTMSTATNVRITNTLPTLTGLALSGFVAPPGTTYDFNTGVWTLPTLARNSTQTLRIAMIPRVGTGGQLPISASLSGIRSDQRDINSANDLPASPAQIRVRGTDFETLDIKVSDTRPNIDQTVTYTLTLRNNGPIGRDALYNSNKNLFLPGRLEVTDLLPRELSFVSASNGGALQGSSNRVVWNLTSFVAPDTTPVTITLTLRARVNALATAGQVIPNQISTIAAFFAGADGTGPFNDPVPGNNAPDDPSVNVTVNDPASIGTPSPGAILEGQSITLTVRYTDNDLGDTHDIRIRWADGAPDSLRTNVVRPGGQISNTVAFTHTYADNPPGGNVWLPTIAITDSQGAFASNVVPVTVDNVPPGVGTRQLLGANKVIPGVDDVYVVTTNRRITVTYPFTDPGFTAFSTREDFLYDVQWGPTFVEGRPPQVTNNSAPGPSAGQVITSHVFSAVTAGPVIVGSRFYDDDGGFASGDFPGIAMIRRVWINNPPQAVDDTLAVREKQSSSVFVLANDVDALDVFTFTNIVADPSIGLLTGAIPATGQVFYSTTTAFDDLAEGATRNDTFSYQIVDQVGFTDTAEVVVTVTGVNDPPRLDLDDTSAALTTTVAFVEDAGPAPIAPAGLIVDIDSNIISATVTLLDATDGAAEFLLSVLPVPGITVTWDGMSNTLLLSGSATPAAYTMALRGVAYNNLLEGGADGERRITVEAWDIDGPSTGPLTNRLTVTRVDDAPIITPTSPSTTIEESQPYEIVDSGITLTDVDSPVFNNGAITITTSSDDNKDPISLLPGNGVTFDGFTVRVDGQAVATLTGDDTTSMLFANITGPAATPANLTRVLRQIAYRRLPGKPPAFVLLEYRPRSSPQGALGNANITINIAPVNDPPEIGLVPFSVFEDTPVNLEASLSFADPEVANQDIIFTATVDSGVLSFSATNSLVDSNASPTIVRVVGRLSRLNDDASIDLVYTPAANFGGTVNFTFALDDTGIEPPPALVTTVPYATDVVDQPDPPVLDLQANNASSDVSVGYTEQAPPVVLAPTTLITDVDSTTMNSAIVEINSFIVGSEVLTYTDSATISEGFNPGIGTLTLTGPAPTADFVALLRSVRYASSSNNPPASRSIRFVVVDDTNLPSTARTATVNITPVNDPAVLVIDPSILNVLEGAAAVLVDPTAQVNDPDTFVTTTSRLTVTVTPPTSSKDELRVRSTVGQITMRSSNSIAVFAGTDIANVAGFGSSQLRFTLLSTANPTNLTALLRAITYERKNGDSVGTRSIRFDLREASLPTATASRPLEVNGANDPPVVTVAPSTVATEDSAANIATSITVTDVDSGAGPLIFTVTVASGRLDFNTASPPPGVTYVSGDLTSQLVLNGTNTALASMLTTASNLVFSPTANFSGTVGLIVQANDQGQAPPGPVGTPPGVGTGTGFIQVRGVNDRPVITLATPTTPEDTLLNVGSSVVISDVDALNGTMRLTATVTNGTIGTTVIAGVTQVSGNLTRIVVTGNIANLRTWLATSSNLRFTPALNFSGNATLQVQLNDQGASGWPPTTPLIDDKTTTITVTPVDDAPAVTVTDAFFNEDTPTGIATRITLVDGDGSPGTVGLTVTVSSGTGILGFGSSPGVTLVGGANTNQLLLQGSLSNLTTMLGVANNIRITPTLNFSGTTTLTALARDLTSGAAGSDTGTLQVRGLNDAPTASYTASSVTVNEDTSVSLAGLIAIGDVDALSFTTRLTVSVGTGTLTVVDGSGVTRDVAASNAQRSVLVGSLANLQTLLNATTPARISFQQATNSPNDTTLAVLYSDLGNSGFAPGPALVVNPGSITIDILPVNDAPSITLPGGNTASVNEDTLLQLGGRVTLADPDAASATIALTLSVSNGSLIRTVPGTLAIVSSTPAQLGVRGTLADLNTFLTPAAAISYSPTLNFNGPAAFNVVVNDLGATGSGGPQQDSDVINITVSPVPDLPVIVGSNVMTVPTTTVGVPITVAVPIASLNATDVDSAPLQVIYTVATLPATGTLRLNGTPLTLCAGINSTFTQADINAGNLRYSHATSASSNQTFTYRLGNALNCSTGSPATLTIRIRP